MPDLTGIRLAQKMLDVRKDMPVILFTGYSEAVSPETAKKAGIREFMMKPIVKREVAKTIRRVLDSRSKDE
jgi:FixJ family two-component response regulator